MIDWVKNQWVALLAFLLSIVVATFTFYRRVFRLEDMIKDHKAEEENHQKHLEATLKDLGDMKVQMARQDSTLTATNDKVDSIHDDVREMRIDIRKVLERL